MPRGIRRASGRGPLSPRPTAGRDRAGSDGHRRRTGTENSMTVDRSHDIETDAERARLRALVARLSDADLRRPMPAGWTVSAVLAHAGFWDARAIYWLDTWGPDG